MLPQQIKTNGGSLRKNNRKRAKSLGYSTDTALNAETGFIIFAAFIIIFIFLAFVINTYIPFKKERDYIKMEMQRSYEEDEYRYWRRELKYLYLRSIPLIGRFFR